MLSLFEELKWRGLIKDCSDESRLEKVLDNEKINFYCGFDPTANSLTLGHLVQINTILLFYKNYHFPFILIGSGTGLIGDPKESKERFLLSKEEIFYNSNSIRSQLENIFLNKKIKLVDNYNWISQIDFISFFRKYGKLFNINYMISKEIVAKRLKKGISYTEFSYMLFQALDFYHLYKEFNVILQFGGSDQWGNITSGLELIRKMSLTKKNNKPLGFSIPLLLDTKGVKFGKSEKNTIWLDKKKSNSYEIYQYLLNISDNDVIDLLKKITLLTPDRIIFLEEETKKNPRQRAAQKELAKFVVMFLHGYEELEKCIKINNILFNKDLKKWDLDDFIFLSKHLDFYKTKENILLVDALVYAKFAISKNEARRLILSNSIKVMGNSITKVDFILESQKAFDNKYVLLTKKNKINFLIIFD
ncbi:tyrosine--tRNA ligase ['Cynodon dactylon' phytoplasma]|uniref:tyrosine--tRNA ligase n=1 Tax='Cynodon dactylon' phytoplasma TaxID=295320 RepID=UPI001265D212|nr:tyrosine--tRNA ligase ['Cynodon dactylon' phytoplasma]KAB8121747.1 tyrosine--tRNA ligase ['Cynodon dactylon' phytoplasma]